MSLEKLKDSARKFEQKEDWRKAIEVYLKAIQQIESGKDATPDLSLYNRVGDLYLKVGDTASAVRHYERAVELYADQGFFNNAIALCGKILRVNPGRTQTYLHLARLHARKNVVIEAKRNLLEYLERMNAQGQLEEAFGAVKAFADQFAGSQDIRGMLVELLRAASRGEEASEQLDQLCEELEATGDAAAARKTRERLEPVAREPEAPSPRRRGGDLVFLDTGFGAPPSQVPGAPAVEPPLETLAPDGLVVTDPFVEAADGEPGADEIAQPLGGFEATSLEPPEPVDVPSEDETSPGFEELIIDRAADGDVEPAGVESVEFEAGPVRGLQNGLELDRPAEPPLGFDATAEPDIDLSDVLAESLNDPDLAAIPPAETDTVELDFIEPAPGEVGLEEASLQSPTAELPPEATPAPVAAMEQRVAEQPDDPAAHRALAEALLAAGESRRAADEFLFAREGYETQEAWREAGDMLARLIQLEPDDIGHYQKLVELAYRTGSRGRMLEAYLALAAALRRVGEIEKAIAVYHRVIDHDPGNPAAETAIAELTGPALAEAPPAPRTATARPAGVPPSRPVAPRTSAEPPAAAPASTTAPAADFVDLGSLVLDEKARPRDTRMRIERAAPSEDEQKNFEEMLAEFKRGIEQNLDVDDYEAHYDLGVAFKEMGLLDEAIAEFQKALRAPEGRLRTSEALGMAFFEKGQFGIAETVLRRGVDAEAGGDEAKIGLLYWLGRSAEAQGKAKDALKHYERALAVDIRFMDLGERVPRLTAGLHA